MKKKADINDFLEIKNIADAIEAENTADSFLAKTFVLSYLAQTLTLKTYVELGVNKGEILLPLAFACGKIKGLCYGIDSFSQEGGNDLYEKLLFNREQFNLTRQVELLRKSPQEVAAQFASDDIVIDMLHINDNQGVDGYLPLVAQNGIIVFNDINSALVKSNYAEAKKNYVVIYESDSFGILINQESNSVSLANAQLLGAKLDNIYRNIILYTSQPSVPEISVSVLTFNHQEFIEQCLDSIVEQVGSFRLKVTVFDDASSDNTVNIIESCIAKHAGNKQISITLSKNPVNIGMTKNFQQAVSACEGADYFALVDGDDYWSSKDKLQRQVDFLKYNPHCSMVFSSIIFYHQNLGKYELFQQQQDAQKTLYNTRDLIRSLNIIGNLSCVLYDAKYIKQISDDLFSTLYVADWVFNMNYSQFGDIGFLKEPMSVYRKHDGGWSAEQPLVDRSKSMIKYIDQYNAFFNFIYDEEFTECRRLFVANLQKECCDLLVIDDVFPHPISGFRYQEYTSYLQDFEAVKVYTTGTSVRCLGTQSVDDLIIEYKQKHPEFSGNISKYNNIDVEATSAKLLYFVFINNAYTFLSISHNLGIPFVFCLYPGGGFGLKNKNSDKMLRAVMSSPNFKKVIVTQKITYDYLLDNKFCEAEKIEYIFGVVTPASKLAIECHDKAYFGVEKNRLDICFVAHKYTFKGEDKGYDKFINVAERLCEKYPNIYFHVVGNFDETVIDVTAIRDKITFYGTRSQDWFDEFYSDKDIVLSPNVPGKIFEGSFDGFPTASCTDAGLRKVAIFCTDLLGLNDGNFVDGEELVIVPYDVVGIASKIAYYYEHPLELKALSEKGCSKIKQIYHPNNQMAPRIKLLESEINNSKLFPTPIIKHTYKESGERLFARFIVLGRKYCPKIIKRIYHKQKRIYQRIRAI